MKNKNIRMFDEQISLKPNRYPWTKQFIDTMWAGFWTPNEFDFKSDKKQFKTEMIEEEKHLVVRSLSAISQIEVAVKRFWSKLGDNLPHPSLFDLGSVMSHVECYSEDTEILTPYGWRYIKDVKVADEVYQFNEDLSLSKTKVLSKIVKPSSGFLYEFSNDNHLCKVTANHDMVIQDSFNSVKKVKAKDISFKNPSLFPITSSGIKNNPKITLSDIDQLYIAILCMARRIRYSYKICLTEKDKVKKLQNILDSINITYDRKSTESIREHRSYFTIYIDKDLDIKSLDWVDLSKESKRYYIDFINEIDYWNTNKKYLHKSLKKETVDIIQCIALLAGYTTSISKSRLYCINISQEDNKFTDSIRKVEISYSGDVVCLSVPSGMILTRLYDKTFIAGNCIHSMAYSKLLDVLNLDKVFEENLNEDVFIDRVNYLKKYLDKEYKDHKQQYIYQLILFTLFTENVSLFSQFYCVLWVNKKRNVLKDTANQIAYTRNEEDCHAKVGIKIINTLREEYPELFTKELENKIIYQCHKAYSAESKIIDWILNGYSNDGISKEILYEFIKDRLNTSLEEIGYSPQFSIDKDLLDKTRWFNEELIGNNMEDFFSSKSTSYSKKNKPFNSDELF